MCLCLSTQGKLRLTLENSEATLNDVHVLDTKLRKPSYRNVNLNRSSKLSLDISALNFQKTLFIMANLYSRLLPLHYNELFANLKSMKLILFKTKLETAARLKWPLTPFFPTQLNWYFHIFFFLFFSL